MKMQILIFRIVLAWIVAGASYGGIAGSLESDATKKLGPDGKLHDPVSKPCVRKDLAGVCQAWDFVYALGGLKCTDDCVHFGIMDDCKVRNLCTFDTNSGCFKKKVCTKLEIVESCASWKERMLCAGDHEGPRKVLER